MIKTKIFRYAIAAIFQFVSLSLAAQSNQFVKYYDSSWVPAPKEAAFYFTQFVKEDTVYKCTSYWMASKKLYAQSTYADTLFGNQIGLLKRYYQNGQLQDSNNIDEAGMQNQSYHFYENGKLWAHYAFNKKTKKETSEGYDEQGKKIPDFVYQKEATFKGGAAPWLDYLSHNIKSNTPAKKGAKKGTYQVIVRFIVSIDGTVSEPVAETTFGFGMEEEVIRVIKKSPKWEAATMLGKPVNAYRRQPVTFLVEEK